MVLYTWDPAENTIRRSSLEEIIEAIYALTMLIPVGRVTSYGNIARVLGINPRLVGLAMKKNNKPIIIPCHRVVAWNGDLKNYSRGGPPVKEKLLRFKGVKVENRRVPREYFIDLYKMLIDPPT